MTTHYYPGIHKTDPHCYHGYAHYVMMMMIELWHLMICMIGHLDYKIVLCDITVTMATQPVPMIDTISKCSYEFFTLIVTATIWIT